jgi:hypothetical protein
MLGVEYRSSQRAHAMWLRGRLTDLLEVPQAAA